MSEYSSKRSFQAVVLAAGRGSRMRDVTDKMPKALVPIGNVPLIYFPLKSLERVGFQETFIIVLKSQKDLIETAISTTDLKLIPKFISIDDDDLGTAESLRLLKDKIDMDIVVVPCDLITDLSFHKLADMHRAKNSSLSLMLSNAITARDIVPPGPKINKKIESQFIALDENQRIVFLSAEADLDDEIRLKQNIIKNHPCLNIHSSLMDSHVYLMNKSIYDLLLENPNIVDLREFIPFVIKRQFSKLNNEDNITKGIESEDNLINEMSSYHHQASIGLPKCFGYYYDGLCYRVNNIISFCEANRQSTKFLEKLRGVPTVSKPSSLSIKPKSTVNNDCLIGENVTVGEKCGIKNSVIGQNTTIGDYCKVTNSIIMKKVELTKGIIIQNCIICDNVTLEEKCELKDCIVGTDQTIHGMAKFSGEAIRSMNAGFDL